MPKVHDSRNDASVAMEVAAFAAAHDPCPLIQRANAEETNSKKCCLRVHRIPPNFTADDLQRLVIKQSTIQPVSVGELTASKGGHQATTIEFMSPAHASLAFTCLKGVQNEDIVGRLQKRIFFSATKYFHVGKMFSEKNSASHSLIQPLPKAE